MASLEDNPVSTVGWARTYKHVLKLEIVGDTVVGKSSLLHQFSHGKFREQYLPTLGFTDREKIVNIGGGDIKLQLWDINGREEYRSVLVKYNYLKGAAGFLLVYDITNRESFENLKTWLALIRQSTSDDPVIVIAANKCDLVDQVQVSEEEEIQFVEEHGYDLVHTSAKLGTNVKEAFSLLVQKVYGRLKGINP